MAADLNIQIKASNLSTGAINSVKSDLVGLEKSATKTVTDFGDKINDIGKKAAIAVGLAAAAMTAAFAKFTADGIGKAADLEEQMGGIAAVMSKTKDEIAPLNDLIKDLGIDPKLKVSTFEAADAIQMLARNGLDMTEILDGAARSTVLLANATDADFGTAADIATDVMAIFNIEAKNMNRAVDGITSVVNNSKFSIDDYALALAQGGGVAGAVGVDFADFNTTIAAISPLFASGSDAGTSFKTFLQRLVPDTDNAETAMMKLGLMTEDGANAFFEATGTMKGMDEIAGLLQDALSGLSEEQQNSALKTIFGTDSMRAAVGLAKVGQDEFLALKNVMGNTSAEDSAATRMDNFAGTMEILRGVIEGVQLSIGEKFLPTLRTLAERLTTLVSDNQSKIEDFFGRMAEWFAVKIPAAMDYAVNTAFPAIYDAFQYLYNEVLPKLQSAIQFVVDHWGFFSAAIKTLAAVFVAASLVSTIAGIVGAITTITGVIGGLITIVTGGGGVVAAIAGGGGMVASLGLLLNPVGLAVAAVGGLALAWATDFGSIRTNTTKQAQMIHQEITGMLGKIKESFVTKKNDWLEAGKNIVSGVRDGLARQAGALNTQIQSIGSALLSNFKHILGIASPSKAFMEAGYNIALGLARGIDSGGGLIDASLGAMQQKTQLALNQYTAFVDSQLAATRYSLEQGAAILQTQTSTAMGFNMEEYAAYWSALQGGASRDEAIAAGMAVRVHGSGATTGGSSSGASTGGSSAIQMGAAPSGFFSAAATAVRDEMRQWLEKIGVSSLMAGGGQIELLKETLVDVAKIIAPGGAGVAGAASIPALIQTMQNLLLTDSMGNLRGGVGGAAIQGPERQLLTDSIAKLTSILEDSRTQATANSLGTYLETSAAGNKFGLNGVLTKIKDFIGNTFGLAADQVAADATNSQGAIQGGIFRVLNAARNFNLDMGSTTGDSVRGAINTLLSSGEGSNASSIFDSLKELLNFRNLSSQQQQINTGGIYDNLGQTTQTGNTFNVTFNGRGQSQESVLADIQFLNSLYGAA